MHRLMPFDMWHYTWKLLDFNGITMGVLDRVVFYDFDHISLICLFLLLFLRLSATFFNI